MRRYGYEEIEHASDIGIKFYGKTMEELFKNAALGMFSMMTDMKRVEANKKILLSLSAESCGLEDMLVLWLEKLLYCFEVDGMLFSEIEVREIYTRGKGIKLKAEVSGEKIDNKRHMIINYIKSPTYHLLEISEDRKKNIFEGRVIFDV